MSRRSLSVVGVLAAVMLAVPLSAGASHSWGGYHWARTTTAPLELNIGDNMTTVEWKAILGESHVDWNLSSVLENRLVAGSSGKNCKAVSGTVQVCNGKYGRNGWLGLAQIWLNNGHISQGVAKMNDTYFVMPAYNNYSEKRHVLCQEIGHTFGLGHTSEDGSSQNTCMDYYHNATDDRISIAPNAHDYEQLEAIYNHTDEGSGSSGSGPGKGNGRNVFVEDLGEGRSIVTFIFWAEGHGPGHGGGHHDG